MSLLWNQPSFSSDFSPLFRLLDDYAEHTSTRDGRNTNRAAAVNFTPRFDIAEHETGYELHGDLPGVKESDLDIEFSDNQTLTIRGKTERHTEVGQLPKDQAGDNVVATQGDKSVEKNEGKGKGYRYWATERVFGSFSRTFTFPSPVDTDGVKAGLKEGVLTVAVPKSGEKSAKKIAISS